MRIFGYEILKGKKVEALETKISKMEADMMIRPSVDQFMMTSDVSKINILPAPPEQIYELAKYSDIIANVTFALKQEMFRNGYDLEPKFNKACADCGKEYENNQEKCDCGSANLREPNDEQKKKLESFFKKINRNRQTLNDVLEQVEDDLNIIDDAFILMVKKYTYTPDGDILTGEIQEVIRGNPKIFRLIADNTGIPGFNDQGKMAKTCPLHRTVLTFDEETTRCPKCGKILYQALYESWGPLNQKMYYLEGEVVHVSKYNPSLLYGWPPIMTVWQKILSLLEMDRTILMWYIHNRPPKGVGFINTANVESFWKAWNKALEEYKMNPNSVPLVAFEGGQNGRKMAEFIDIMATPKEMEFIEMRNEFRKTVGAVFGVMPLFQADVTASGGLNNEGLQITVTNRAVSRGQRIYNDKIFPKLLQEFGITDWMLKLNPNEEQDEMAPITRLQAKANVAATMKTMGFEVTYDPEEEEFTYSDTALNPAFQSTPLNALNPSPGVPDFQHQGGPESSGILEEGQRFEGEPDYPNKTLEKAGPPKEQKDEADDLEDELKDELQKIVEREVRLGRKPTPAQMKNLAEKIGWKLKSRLQKLTATEIKSVYKDAIAQVEKETKLDIGFGEVDENAVEVVTKSKIFRDAFDHYDKAIRNDVMESMKASIRKNLTLGEIVDELKKTIEAREGSLMRIARTESQNVQTLARNNSYNKVDKEGKFRYKWIGPDDWRTTKYCKKIQKRTANGVTMKQLKEIIQAEADPRTFGSSRPFTPHINCRHTFVRVQ